MLAKLLIETTMKNANKSCQLLIKGWGRVSHTYDVEAWSYTFFKKKVWQGLLLVNFLFQNTRETLFSHLEDNVFLSLEELKEHSYDF